MNTWTRQSTFAELAADGYDHLDIYCAHCRGITSKRLAYRYKRGGGRRRGCDNLPHLCPGTRDDRLWPRGIDPTLCPDSAP
jgi:hypothetical protein